MTNSSEISDGASDQQSFEVGADDRHRVLGMIVKYSICAIALTGFLFTVGVVTISGEISWMGYGIAIAFVLSFCAFPPTVLAVWLSWLIAQNSLPHECSRATWSIFFGSVSAVLSVAFFVAALVVLNDWTSAGLFTLLVGPAVLSGVALSFGIWKS